MSEKLLDFKVRVYFREEDNPDNVFIKTDSVKAKSVGDAYEQYNIIKVIEDNDGILLNWFIEEK